MLPARNSPQAPIKLHVVPADVRDPDGTRRPECVARRPPIQPRPWRLGRFLARSPPAAACRRRCRAAGGGPRTPSAAVRRAGRSPQSLRAEPECAHARQHQVGARVEVRCRPGHARCVRRDARTRSRSTGCCPPGSRRCRQSGRGSTRVTVAEFRCALRARHCACTSSASTRAIAPSRLQRDRSPPVGVARRRLRRVVHVGR